MIQASGRGDMHGNASTLKRMVATVGFGLFGGWVS